MWSGNSASQELWFICHMGKRKTAGSRGISFPLPKGKFASVIAGFSKKRGRFKGGEGFIRCAAPLLCFPGFPTRGGIFPHSRAHLACVSAVGLGLLLLPQFLQAHQKAGFHLDQSLQAHEKAGFYLCLPDAITHAGVGRFAWSLWVLICKINTPKRHY